MANKYLQIKKQLVEYYQDLLIIQYHNKPKATATVKAKIEETLCNLLDQQIKDAFDVDTSVGAQLDIIGKWVGVNRIFKGQKFDDRPWFSLPAYSQEPDIMQHGFSRFSTFDTEQGGILTYDYIVGTSNKLNDKDFRMLIKLKIIRNHTIHSPKEIDDALYRLFEKTLYAVWGECMEMTFYYDPKLYGIVRLGKSKGYFPVPTGVKANYLEVKDGKIRKSRA